MLTIGTLILIILGYFAKSGSLNSYSLRSTTGSAAAAYFARSSALT
jgi:hypothetical protein